VRSGGREEGKELSPNAATIFTLFPSWSTTTNHPKSEKMLTEIGYLNIALVPVPSLSPLRDWPAMVVTAFVERTNLRRRYDPPTKTA
jgi:hypothetical protein